MQQQFPQASHNSDPASSHIAEREITESGTRAKHAAHVLELVDDYEGWTAAELVLVSGLGLDRHQIAKRLSDLKNLNKVRRGATRTCAELGNTCATWFPVRGSL